MIRIIKENSQGKFSNKPEDYRYIDDNHLDLFLSPEKLKKHNIDLSKPQHWSLYFTKNKKYLNQFILCLDYDLKDKKDPKPITDHTEAQILLLKISETLKIPQTCFGIVSTGYGYHFYIFFNQKFSVTEKPVLKQISAELKKIESENLEYDPLSFCMQKSMRLPYSFYAKEGRVNKQTQVLLKPSKLYPFTLFYENFKHLEVKPKEKKTQANDLKDIYKTHKPNLAGIFGTDDNHFSGCRFMRWTINDKQNVTYPEWQLHLSIAAKLFKNENDNYLYAKKLSEGHPKFNEAEFKKEFLKNRYEGYPATCETIARMWKHSDHPVMGCKTCPHRKLNMPIKIDNYPNKDTGFRKPEKDKDGNIIEYKKIDYESFAKFLFEEIGLRTEKDESIWEYDDGFFKVIPDTIFNSKYCEKYIRGGVAPPEIRPLAHKFKHIRVMCQEEAREKNKHWLVFNNLIFNTKTRDKVDHTRDIFKTFKLDFDFNENAKAEKFSEILDFCFGDSNEREFFLQYLACSIFDTIHFEKALILFGTGRNGKSTLMNAVKNMFSEGSDVISPFSFKDVDKDLSYIRSLRTSRLAYNSDMSSREINKDPDLFKKLISGEQLTYRIPYAKSYINFEPKCNFVLGMNMLPTLAENTKGMKRRFAILNFDKAVPQKMVDIDLGSKLLDERAGIFNILYEAYQTYLRNGQLPQIDQSILKETFSKGSIFNMWEETNLIEHKNSKISMKQLYNNYRDFALESGESKAVPLNIFVTNCKSSELFSGKINTKITERTQETYVEGLGIVNDKSFKNDTNLEVVDDANKH